jgi:PAS domain S-box-containing protein
LPSRDARTTIPVRMHCSWPCRFLLLAAVLSSGLLASEGAKQQVALVIYSDSRIQPGMMIIDQAIREPLAKLPAERLAYFTEFLDTVHLPGKDYEDGFAAYLGEKYRQRRIDVILCVRDAAFAFALQHRDVIAPGAPLLYMGVAAQRLAGLHLSDDVAGLPMEIDVAPVVALARRLHPGTRFAVAGGCTPFDRQWLDAFRAEFAGHEAEVTWLVDRSLEEVVAAAAALPSDTVLLIGYFGSDALGRTFVPLHAGEQIFATASVPSYVCYSNVVGTGATGGSVFDLEDAGRRAGAALLRVLDGERPADLGLQPLRPVLPMLDARQLRRWGIAEGALPPGARVINRETSFWQAYWHWILGAVLVIACQAALIAALLTGRRRLQRAQAGLLESEQRMSLATSAASVGLWVLDLRSGGFWANATCRRLIGLGADDSGGLARLMAPIHPDDRPRSEAIAGQALQAGADFDDEFRILLPDGTVRWIHARGRVELAGDGKPLRMLGVVLDISEHKRMEQDIERHRLDLAHLARVSSLGELSGSLAHELNQPLTAILGNAQAALRHLDRPEPDMAEVHEILSDIVRLDKGAGEVIQRMRAMLRKEDSVMRPLDLRTVVEDVLLMLRSHLVAANVACVSELGALPARISGDPVQLQQVLINLVVNACDAMCAAGVPERRLCIRIVVEDGIRCDVIDHGPGIPPEQRERIFETFVSLKPSGLGMGLSICRTIVHQHGGSLVVADAPGEGACLRLRLPQARPSGAAER